MSSIDERIVSMKFNTSQFEAGIKTTVSSLDGLKRSLNLDAAKKSLEGLNNLSKNFTMKFNNKEFEAGAKGVKTTADNTVKTLGDLDKAGKNVTIKPNTSIFESGMKNAMTHMSSAITRIGDLDLAAKKIDLAPVSASIDKLSAKFSGMSVVGIAALAALGAKAAIVGAQMASSLMLDPAKSGLAEYEKNLGSIQTIMSNTQWENKSLKDVNAALDELNAYSDKTIYNFADMADAIGKFTSAGVSLDDSTAAIKGISNLAAISGSNSQQASTAMQQLSQAMSAGKVGLEDWNSVVNAGMGGKVFQDALIETARNQGSNVDSLIAKHGSFRQSLQDGWITTKVMNETLAKMTGDLTDKQLKAMGYNDEQIVGIQKMAKNAQDAATKIKTFTQLTGTLTEITGSGWAQSWKLVLGDFEQAKAMWTNVYKVLGGMVQASADARNKLLGDWNKLGGRTAMIEAVSNAFKALMNIVNPIKKAFRDVFPATTGKQLYALTVMIRDFTRSLIANRDQMGAIYQVFKFFFSIIKLGMTIIGGVLSVFKAFFGALFSGGESVNETAKAFGIFFEKINAILKNTAFIDKFFKMIGEGAAWLGNIIGGAIREIVFNAGILLIRLQTVMIKIKMHIDHVIAVIKIFAIQFQTLLIPVFYSINSAIQTSLRFIGRFRDMIVGVIDAFINGGFQSGVDAFVKGLGDMGDIAKWEFKRLGRIGSQAMGDFGEGVVDTWETVTTRVRERIESIQRFGQRIADMAQRVWTALEPMRTAIKDLFDDIGRNVADVFKDVNFDDSLDLINTGLLAGIVILWRKFVKGGLGFGGDIKDSILGNIDGMFEGVKGALDGLTGTLGAMQKNLQADTLMKIALAIAILTASVILLALIDSAALTKSIIAISVMFGLLAGTLATFEKVVSTKGALKMVPLAAGLMLLGFAILILASAVKKLSDLSWGELIKGLVGVTVLLGAVARAASIMSKNAANLIATGIGMIAIAIAIKILASAVKDFSDISWGDMIKGLVGVGALLAAIAIFNNFNKVNKGAVASGIGLILLGTALKIMASAIGDFAAMNLGALIQGIAALGIVLVLVANFSKAVGNIQEIFKMAAAMVVLGFAMKIFASAVNDFGSLSLEVLAKGLTAMAIALKAITVSMRALPPNMLANAVGMIAIAVAMKIMAGALKSMGGMSWEEIAKGLVTMAVALGVIAIATRLMTTALPGAAAIFVVAAALAVMAPVLKTLGEMTWEQLLHGLAGLAGIFVVLGLAALVLSPLTPVILALGTAMALFGAGILAVGLGTVIFAGGLVALGTAVAVAGPLLILFIGAILALIPIAMMELGKGIVAFAGVIGNAMPVFADAFTKLLMTLLNCIIIVAPKIGQTLGVLITTLLNLLLRSVPEFVDKGMRIIIGILDGIGKNLGKLIDAAANLIVQFLNGMARNLPRIIEAGANLIIKFMEGIGKQIRPLLEAGAKLILDFLDGLADTIDNNRQKITEAGGNLARAIIDGMTGGLFSGIGDVWNAAMDLGNKAMEAIGKAIDAHSPSKRAHQFGEWTGEGFAMGITSLSGAVDKAATGIGETALDSLQKTISGIAIEADMDMSPVIRPVLDLSAVEKDSRLIGGMLAPSSLAVGGTFAKATILSNNALAAQEAVNGMDDASMAASSGPSVIINQHNTSPKALSRVDIYRDTKNAISVAKGALTGVK